jgi:transcriptional regulator with XRE-family HTH domain
MADVADFAGWLDRQITRQGVGAARDVADAVGVSSATISRWRRGLNRPGAHYWPRLDRAFGVAPGTVERILLAPPMAGDVLNADGGFERLVVAVERIAETLERS